MASLFNNNHPRHVDDIILPIEENPYSIEEIEDLAVFLDREEKQEETSRVTKFNLPSSEEASTLEQQENKQKVEDVLVSERSRSDLRKDKVPSLRRGRPKKRRRIKVSKSSVDSSRTLGLDDLDKNGKLEGKITADTVGVDCDSQEQCESKAEQCVSLCESQQEKCELLLGLCESQQYQSQEKCESENSNLQPAEQTTLQLSRESGKVNKYDIGTSESRKDKCDASGVHKSEVSSQRSDVEITRGEKHGNSRDEFSTDLKEPMNFVIESTIALTTGDFEATNTTNPNQSDDVDEIKTRSKSSEVKDNCCMHVLPERCTLTEESVHVVNGMETDQDTGERGDFCVRTVALEEDDTYTLNVGLSECTQTSNSAMDNIESLDVDNEKASKSADFHTVNDQIELQNNVAGRVPKEMAHVNCKRKITLASKCSRDVTPSWNELTSEQKDSYRKWTMTWALQEFEVNPQVCLPHATVFMHYENTCRKSHIPVMFKTCFGRILQKAFKNLSTRRLGSRGGLQYYCVGMDIREDSPSYSAIVKQRVFNCGGKRKVNRVF